MPRRQRSSSRPRLPRSLATSRPATRLPQAKPKSKPSTPNPITRTASSSPVATPGCPYSPAVPLPPAVELVLAHRNSSQALELLKAGHIHIAGTHLADGSTAISRLFSKELGRCHLLRGLGRRTGHRQLAIPKALRHPTTCRVKMSKSSTANQARAAARCLIQSLNAPELNHAKSAATTTLHRDISPRRGKYSPAQPIAASQPVPPPALSACTSFPWPPSATTSSSARSISNYRASKVFSTP